MPALRRKPIGFFTAEDLRIMLGQHERTSALLPRALDVLERNPLAEGDYYPGDLLVTALKIPPRRLDRESERGDSPPCSDRSADAAGRSGCLLSAGRRNMASDSVIEDLRHIVRNHAPAHVFSRRESGCHQSSSADCGCSTWPGCCCTPSTTERCWSRDIPEPELEQGQQHTQDDKTYPYVA
ncbi:contact-dependent growth inhibition system immunity protein [Nocardia sp. NPDC051990]|uniref:contact-dependent growth inhibition system immunity protein n=1 Tax=Nocardia sp. NPDC051990 TaxID=3155285 RepID=UPI003421653F